MIEHAKKKEYENAQFFGPLLKYILDDTYTDVDWNGKNLWLTSVTNERKQVEEIGIDDAFFQRFAQRIANINGAQFNKMHPILEAETERLRISIIHEAKAVTGLSCCIRKTPPIHRITTQGAIKEKYCSEKILHLMVNCIKAHMNLVVCGEPKAGKTEFCKYLSSYIPDSERVYTIEDVLEWHYPKLKPKADCIEIRVDEHFTYSDAIKAALKQNPRWLCLTEARGNEVRELIKCFSTGVAGMTTLHTDSVVKVPQRMSNMVEDKIDMVRFENNIYEFIDVAVLIGVHMDGTGRRYRRIAQVGFFTKDVESGRNSCQVIYMDGKFLSDDLPEQIRKKFLEAKVEDPFFNQEITEELAQRQEEQWEVFYG